jgi:hypothetical protein
MSLWHPELKVRGRVVWAAVHAVPMRICNDICWIGCCVEKVVSQPGDHSIGDTGIFAFTQRSNLLILS